MVKVDVNCDMGESFGIYTLGLDSQAIQYITSANIACGFHGGDPAVMDKTVQMAGKHSVKIGAHPGYPDISGFGRRKMAIPPEEMKNIIIYQIGALKAFCDIHDVEMQHVKLHGALYNEAAVDMKLAAAIARGIYQVDRNLIFLVLAGSRMEEAGMEIGLKTASEVFGDRNYNADGSLVSRQLPNAMVKDRDEAAKRVLRMVKEGKVTAVNGEDISIRADSICVHGDTQGAVDFLKDIRTALERESIQMVPLGEVLANC